MFPHLAISDDCTIRIIEENIYLKTSILWFIRGEYDEWEKGT